MSDQSAPTIDAVLAAGGWNATKAGTLTTFAGWMLSSEGTALCGILIGVTGLLVQWFYKRREDRRSQEEHEARMRSLP